MDQHLGPGAVPPHYWGHKSKTAQPKLDKNPSIESAGATTFRISAIPASVSRKQLLEFVTRIISSDVNGNINHNAAILDISVAPDPFDRRRFQVATITFEGIPPKLIPCVKRGVALSFEVDVDNVALKVSVDSHFIGLTPLNDGMDEIGVDIIFITGLAGHAFGSWKAAGEDTMWIRDLLAPDLDFELSGKPRILTYGYESKVFDSTSNAGIREFSRSFLEAIRNARRLPDESQRPIIFVAHNVGGIVLKQALAEAATGSDKDLNIFHATYACIFLGVPNRGMNTGQLKAMVNGQPNECLIMDLRVESQLLDTLHHNFCERFSFKDSRVISVYETKPEVVLVAKESAIYSTRTEARYDQLSRDVDNATLAKFTRADQDYITLRGRIIDCIEEAPGVIEKRFSATTTTAGVNALGTISRLSGVSKLSGVLLENGGPSPPVSISSGISNYEGQDRWNEAEELSLRLVQTCCENKE